MNKIFILIILFFTLSCSSDLDFEQANNINSEPVYVSNFAAFDVLPNQFIVGGMEQTEITDLLDYDIFKEAFFNTNLKKVDFSFEINNTINRDFIVEINYLDSKNNILYTVPFKVPAYTGTINLVTQKDIFENTKLDLLKQTRKLEFVVSMLTGPALSGSSTGSLTLRSSATIYIVLE